jgi:hypothetical protein
MAEESTSSAPSDASRAIVEGPEKKNDNERKNEMNKNEDKSKNENKNRIKLA